MGVKMRTQRAAAAASTFHRQPEGFVSGRGQCWGSGTLHLKWDGTRLTFLFVDVLFLQEMKTMRRHWKSS